MRRPRGKIATEERPDLTGRSIEDLKALHKQIEETLCRSKMGLLSALDVLSVGIVVVVDSNA
jgi:hypothetical protein